MCDALRELFANELEQREQNGIIKGTAEGEQKKLIQMVCKKLLKSKSPEEIADDLEEELDTIQKICQAAKPFAPDYPCSEIYAALSAQPES